VNLFESCDHKELRLPWLNFSFPASNSGAEPDRIFPGKKYNFERERLKQADAVLFTGTSLSLSIGDSPIHYSAEGKGVRQSRDSPKWELTADINNLNHPDNEN
jgi:hypothetical protein